MCRCWKSFLIALTQRPGAVSESPKFVCRNVQLRRPSECVRETDTSSKSPTRIWMNRTGRFPGDRTVQSVRAPEFRPCERLVRHQHNACLCSGAERNRGESKGILESLRRPFVLLLPKSIRHRFLQCTPAGGTYRSLHNRDAIRQT